MANNLTSNITRKVLRKFLPMLVNDCVSAKSVNRQIIADRDFNPSSGDTVDVKRPHQYRSVRTSDGDVSGETVNDFIAGKASAVVQDYITVEIEANNLERAIKLDQIDEILKPAAQRIVTTLETSLNQFMLRYSAHQLGTAATRLTAWSEVAKVDAFCHAFGFPTDGMVMAQMSPFDVANLADVQAGQFNNNQNAVAWEMAQLTKNIGGINYFRSNSLKTHTNGAYGTKSLTLGATPTQTYVAAKDTYQTTLVINNLPASTTGALKAGDVLQVYTAGSGWLQQQTKEALYGEKGDEVLYTATVNADADSDSSGVATVVVNGPAIYEATGQYNTIASALASGDSVRVISGSAGTSNTPNMFYHKDAFGLATVRLPRLEGGVESSSASYEGISVRVSRYANGQTNKQSYRFDLLPAFASFNPLLAGRFFGGDTPGQS